MMKEYTAERYDELWKKELALWRKLLRAGKDKPLSEWENMPEWAEFKKAKSEADLYYQNLRLNKG